VLTLLATAQFQAVRPRQRFLVFVQFISASVAELKWYSFWATVVRFSSWGGGAIALHQITQNLGTGGTII
jgi:hypothetical protein